MSDKMTVTATKDGSVTTRLIAGVELKLTQTGKHWTLSAKPESKK